MVSRVIPVDEFDLVIFGGTGDLARRKILPGLFRRFLSRQMPAGSRIIGAARSELDEDKRAAMYRETQLLVNDDGGAIIPMFANHIMGVSTKVAHGDDVAANWEMDGEKAPERWWFA